jgi:hypothetical protein
MIAYVKDIEKKKKTWMRTRILRYNMVPRLLDWMWLTVFLAGVRYVSLGAS